jgi:aldose 1-epimerase
MENDKDLCPLGSLGASDIQQLVDVEKKNLDLVYFSKEQAVTTEFITGETQYRLFGSEGFHHTVIYTPKGEPFVCIEPQSCSTDFINLFARGFQQVSGFQFLIPGEKKKGLIVIEAGQVDKQ